MCCRERQTGVSNAKEAAELLLNAMDAAHDAILARSPDRNEVCFDPSFCSRAFILTLYIYIFNYILQMHMHSRLEPVTVFLS